MSDRETRHLDEHRRPDDSDRYPPEWVRCELCQGSGWVSRHVAGRVWAEDRCPRCDGAGELIDR
jgi:DnaJ-class molecular chaperone